MTDVDNKCTIDFWVKMESIIKKYESSISLFFIILVIIAIPVKILCYGWLPVDDAKRHVAFATIDAKWSDILVMDEKYDTEHNAGWHQTLSFLHKHCGLSKDDLLDFSVVGLFLLFHFCGLIASPSPICWCLAFFLLLNIDPGIGFRLLFGRPYLVSCASTFIILRFWAVKYYKEDDFAIFKNLYAKYFFTIMALSLSVWIHGSWYIFLLIPFSFFLAGKTADAVKLLVCIIVSTLLGAALSGDFFNFLYFHVVATQSIFSEPTYNWLLVTEFATGMQNVYWVIFAALIIYLCNHKYNYKLSQLGDDPAFIMILLCWLAGVFVIRFWSDWGRIALLFWLSYRLGELIKSISSLKKPRIRYSLFIFILIGLFICFTNDSKGRYTKAVFEQPIDFYNAETIDKLEGWKPGDGGIVYAKEMYVFYQHFYEYPTAKWKYVLGFEPAIMKKEDRETLRNIGYTKDEEEYEPWIKKMTENDRLILGQRLYIYPQLEWIQANKSWWIGRLKRNSEEKQLKKN